MVSFIIWSGTIAMTVSAEDAPQRIQDIRFASTSMIRCMISSAQV